MFVVFAETLGIGPPRKRVSLDIQFCHKRGYFSGILLIPGFLKTGLAKIRTHLGNQNNKIRPKAD